MGVRRTNIATVTTSTTVGEANSEMERRFRRDVWARAVFTTLLLFAGALVLAYGGYRAVDTVRTGSGAWRLLIIESWFPYATLANVILCYMDLSLPLAPVAARNALLVVYLAGLVLFMVIGVPIFVYGHASAIIALTLSLAAAIAGLLALWLWLDRTYRTVDYLPR